MAEDIDYVEIRPSEGQGRGMFAKIDIPSGTMIWEEGALVVSQTNSALDVIATVDLLERTKPEDYFFFMRLQHIAYAPPIPGVHLSREEVLAVYPPGAPEPEVNRGVALAIKAYLEGTEVNAAGERKLTSDYTELLHREEAPLVLSRFELNSFSITPNQGDATSKAVFFNAALLNHSCIPNCNPVWTPETKKFAVYAMRDILADEELRLTYSPRILIHLSLEKRNAFLKMTYDFHCTCLGCDPSSEISKKMDAIAAQMYKIKPLSDASKEDKRKRGLDVEYEKVLRLMGEDAVFDNWRKGFVHFELLQMYVESGNPAAIQHGDKAYKLAVRCFGPDHRITKWIDALCKKAASLAVQS